MKAWSPIPNFSTSEPGWKGPQDIKPDGLNKDLLLASLFGGSFGACRTEPLSPWSDYNSFRFMGFPALCIVSY